MMNKDRPYVLSIAGLDPSGGAGILADIKTFELNKTAGLAVCTALTFQNDLNFTGLKWVSTTDIKKQVEILYHRFSVEWVKIGLIQDLSVLQEIILYLKKLNQEIKIIWDPVFKASAGFIFHDKINVELLEELLVHLYLITPNLEEAVKIYPELNAKEAAIKLNHFCKVLLKGGHGKTNFAVDILYDQNGITEFESIMIEGGKHGTGCVLSAAILSHLALGKDLKAACKEGKNYINNFIISHKGQLGYHYV